MLVEEPSGVEVWVRMVAAAGYYCWLSGGRLVAASFAIVGCLFKGCKGCVAVFIEVPYLCRLSVYNL